MNKSRFLVTAYLCYRIVSFPVLLCNKKREAIFCAYFYFRIEKKLCLLSRNGGIAMSQQWQKAQKITRS